MEITDEMEEMIVNLGAFGYNLDKMANILDIDKHILEIEIQDNQSQFSILLQKGKDLADYTIDLKLLELAQLGDLKALAEFNKRKITTKLR